MSGQSADRECFLQCVLWAAVKRDGFFMIWRMKSLHARLRPQEDDASVINQRQMRNWSANQSETILPNSPKENCYYKKTTSFLTFANFFFEKTGRNWNPQPDFSSDSWPIFFFIFARSNPSRRLTFLTWSCAVVNVHGFIIKKRANRDWRCSMKPTFLLRTYIISYTISSRLNRHLAAWKVTVQQQSPEPSNIIR